MMLRVYELIEINCSKKNEENGAFEKMENEKSHKKSVSKHSKKTPSLTISFHYSTSGIKSQDKNKPHIGAFSEISSVIVSNS